MLGRRMMQSKAKGFTLVEIMISLFIGAFILGGVMFTYIGMKQTTSDTADLGELQESGRLVMDILKRDIEMSGFWGNFNMVPDVNLLAGTLPDAPNPDCFAGENNATFPAASNRGFRQLFAIEAANNPVMNCIDSANLGSDVLQIKRVMGENVKDMPTALNQHYFVSSNDSARIVKANGGVINANNNEKVWEYMHNIYFVEDQTYLLNGEDRIIPTLRRMRLISGEMGVETIMEGVENIRLIFGLDTNGDNRVDIYRTTAQMTEADWAQQGAVVATVQVFLLVRTLQEDLTNVQEQTFIMGGEGDTARTLIFNDGFRRKMLTSTIRLLNGGEDKWAI